MAFLIRALVSADRQRFKEGDYDLDLTYITPRIIAMGFPASGIEGAWRNSIDEVATMLRKYHSGKYMVWNLSDRPYDYSIFEDQVMEFGFPDHHAPPLNLLFKIMLSLYRWIRADPLNVAVIHCLGGKGRTGTVIVCYFLLLGLFDDPSLGLDYFANKRSNIALGVSQPCQRDCVGYFAKILQQNFVPLQVPYCLSKIVMYGVNQQGLNAFRPIIKVYDVRSYPRKRIYSTDSPEEAENNITRWTNHEEVPNNAVVWQFPKKEMTVAGDVLVRVYHMPAGGGKKIFVFRFSFHTAFLEAGVLSLTEADLSAEKRFSSYHTNNFFMHIFFGEPVGTPPADIETENTYIEENCKMFQKIYAERNTAKIDTLDTKPTPSSSSVPTNGASSFFSTPFFSSSSSVPTNGASSSSPHPPSLSSSSSSSLSSSSTSTTTTATHAASVNDSHTTISDDVVSTTFTTTHHHHHPHPNKPLPPLPPLPSESDEVIVLDGSSPPIRKNSSAENPKIENSIVGSFAKNPQIENSAGTLETENFAAQNSQTENSATSLSAPLSPQEQLIDSLEEGNDEEGKETTKEEAEENKEEENKQDKSEGLGEEFDELEL